MKSIIVWICGTMLLLLTSACTEKKITSVEKDIVYTYYDQLLVNGNTAYVAKQYYRMGVNNWIFDSVALLVPVNVDDSSEGNPLRLNYSNAGGMIMRGGDLYVCTMGGWATRDSGGIEKVNLSSGVATVLITESEISPEATAITNLIFKNDSIVYCLYAKSDYLSGIAVVNINTGTLLKHLSGITDAAGGMALDENGKKLYVGDRGNAFTDEPSGLRIFSTANDSLVSGLISTGLPPYSMAFDTAKNKLYLTTSDYFTAKAKYFDVIAQTLSSVEMSFYQDCVVRLANGKVFVLERGSSSNVAEITEELSLVTQRHLADNSNPVDLAHIGGNRYVVSLNNLSTVTFQTF